LSPRQCSGVASPGKARAALSVLKFRYIGKRQLQKQLLLRSDALPLVTQHLCTVVMTRPGVRPGGRPTFFASPKKDRQKKATPMIAPRCAGSPCRRRLKRGAAKLATLRCAQTDAAPYPLQASPSRRAQRGFEKQRQLQKPMQLQLQLQLRTTDLKSLAISLLDSARPTNTTTPQSVSERTPYAKRLNDVPTVTVFRSPPPRSSAQSPPAPRYPPPPRRPR
jgi:hypothetical protein